MEHRARTLPVLGMDASSRLISVLFFIVAGPCQTECTYGSILNCQRLVSPAVTSVLTPCQFPCIIPYLRAPFNIIVQPEPDGTPCRYMGHCNEGACLDIGNHAAAEHYQWGPISDIRSYHNSNTNGDSHTGSTVLSTSGGYATSGFLSETNLNRHTDQVINENDARLFARELSARKSRQQLLRMKRAARSSNEEGHDGLKMHESGKYVALARFRRSNKKRRRNRNRGRPQNNYNRNRYYNGNMRGAGSGPYGPPYAPHNPTVIVVDSPRKKGSRGSTALKLAAGGLAAGAAGYAGYKLAGGGSTHGHTSSSGAGGTEDKNPQPKETGPTVSAVSTPATTTGNPVEEGSSTDKGAGGAGNDDKEKTDGTEAGTTTKAEGSGTDVTGTAGTDGKEKTTSSKTDVTGETGNDKPEKTDNTGTNTTEAINSKSTDLTVKGQDTGTNATEKSTPNGDSSSSALPAAAVPTAATRRRKVSMRIDESGIHLDVDAGTEGRGT
ncbi:ras guanine nucleotide exchange factor E-like isoform X3 [Dermacentor silvarum]|uniref:ras guanine nucleotide exchange factor E-like isoform X3 n=1 Tax=Dermacentor silvarum TaxID=543639 RepID=UPI00210116D9|nr:ras guanine nucleotide exchange factor E-like isoform X3 [Dermacentor silvarum]XP_049519384.1 ras guanine nucleotide exchange factor E-like isoform X3 [Dermacentor silvarum]